MGITFLSKQIIIARSFFYAIVCDQKLLISCLSLSIMSIYMSVHWVGVEGIRLELTQQRHKLFFFNIIKQSPYNSSFPHHVNLCAPPCMYELLKE